MMKRVILGLIACGAMLAVASAALATCADGGIACGDLCGVGACNTAGGTSYTGMCVGGSDQAADCALTRCSSTTPACVSGPGTKQGQGCASDSQCGSGYICVSSSGSAGCGTGFSQCYTACTDATTTTTSTSTSTSSTSTTSTSTTSTT